MKHNENITACRTSVCLHSTVNTHRKRYIEIVDIPQNWSTCRRLRTISHGHFYSVSQTVFTIDFYGVELFTINQRNLRGATQHVDVRTRTETVDFSYCFECEMKYVKFDSNLKQMNLWRLIGVWMVPSICRNLSRLSTANQLILIRDIHLKAKWKCISLRVE